MMKAGEVIHTLLIRTGYKHTHIHTYSPIMFIIKNSVFIKKELKELLQKVKND